MELKKGDLVVVKMESGVPVNPMQSALITSISHSCPCKIAAVTDDGNVILEGMPGFIFHAGLFERARGAT